MKFNIKALHVKLMKTGTNNSMGNLLIEFKNRTTKFLLTQSKKCY